MKIRSFKYYFKEAILSLIRNRLMSLASFITVSACVFILTVSYCLASNIDYFLSQIERTIGVTVIIDKTMPTDKVNVLYNLITNMEHVKSVKYVSADEALKQFGQELGDSASILKGFENDNPLPRSFIIDIDNSAYQGVIINEIEKHEGVESVRHAKKEAELLSTINNSIRIISLVNFLVLGLISVIIITNTIKLTVNSRRAEISIMKYVGATNWFIRWPFVIEGILIGAFGAVIPVIFCWLGYSSFIVFLNDRIPFVQIANFRSDYEIFTFLAPLTLLLGVLIGVIGSAVSIRKHLKV